MLTGRAGDVWALGVVLYEVWSRGAVPYAKWPDDKVRVFPFHAIPSHLTHLFSMNLTGQVAAAVLAGYRLPPPPGCPLHVYRCDILTTPDVF